MKLFRKMVVFSLIGVGIGSILSLVFSLIHGEYAPGVPEFLDGFSNTNKAMIVQTIIFIVLGILQGFSSEIFKNAGEQNFKMIFLKHYLLIMLPLLLAGYYLKWFVGLKTLMLMLVFSSFLYAVIALVSYLSVRNDIKKINSKLSNYK